MLLTPAYLHPTPSTRKRLLWAVFQQTRRVASRSWHDRRWKDSSELERESYERCYFAFLYTIALQAERFVGVFVVLSTCFSSKNNSYSLEYSRQVLFLIYFLFKFLYFLFTFFFFFFFFTFYSTVLEKAKNEKLLKISYELENHVSSSPYHTSKLKSYFSTNGWISFQDSLIPPKVFDFLLTNWQ